MVRRSALVCGVVAAWSLAPPGAGAGGGGTCVVGDLAACGAGEYCAAEWEEGQCPERGVCRRFLPLADRRLEFSLPIPAGDRIYCAKGSLRPGRSTHSVCDASTRFAIDLSGTAAELPRFVLASADGVVRVFAGCATRDLNRQEAPDPCNYGFGNLVRIEHAPHLYSQVAHLSSVLIQDGETVRRGDVLGIEGNTGNAGAKHIHFSLHLGSARAPIPGPSLPFPRLRVRQGGGTRVVTSLELRCGDFERNPIPDPATLHESENRPGRYPPPRFGFLTWLDEAVRAATSRDPTLRHAAIATLRAHYDEAVAPYWTGVAYLVGGDITTAEEELQRSLLRAMRGEGPPWLRPWTQVMLGQIYAMRRLSTYARRFLEDALGTPGPDPTGFRRVARRVLGRINSP